MKINLVNLGRLIIIIAIVSIHSSCKEENSQPEDKQETTSALKSKPSADTVKEKVIYKKPETRKPIPQKKEPNVYVVKKGEWLWDIARTEYGTAMARRSGPPASRTSSSG